MTIERNAHASRKREGGGACRLSRKIKEINKDFINYGGHQICEEYAKRINI